MSVATAGAAVGTQQHQATQEQIRLAQLIDDKKHNQPEVQEIIRKVLDVVENSNQEDALVALFDCDYDYEKAVALLIEKGQDVASEWRTATNHKLSKKQQKGAATKNGHDELNENGQQQQRGNNTSTSRGKSRGGRSRGAQNGGDSHNNNQQQQNEGDVSQQRQRGGSGYRGRFRGGQRGAFRGADRNHQQQQQYQQQQAQDSNPDTTSPSDTNRRSKGGAASGSRQQQQEPWDVGNWNGETLIISRTTKEDEQPANSDNASAVQNGQSDAAGQVPSKNKFDPIEAARQIKDVIGIGQAAKPSISDPQPKSKATGPPLSSKVTPPPPPTQQRIPHQPVIFSDRFDGGVNKIDVQFGNLGESFDEAAAASFYPQAKSAPSNNASQQRPVEHPPHVLPSTRPAEQPMMGQQRILLTQMQQPSMTIKPVVAPQYAVHQQQHQATPPSMLIQSLLYHHQQPDSVALDASYDPSTFPLPSLEFSTPYFMTAPMSQAPPQQQTQPRYIVPQPHPTPQQTATKNAQAPPASASNAASTAKKAPAVPPGMFPPTGAPPQLPQAAYSTPYGVQQATGASSFAAPYDAEHLFSGSFMPLTNPQQAQSPPGAYSSVTPPVQQQNQQQPGGNNNDNKGIGFRQPMAENLILLQQMSLQQSNSQQHGQQAAGHSPAMNYFLGHPPSGSNFSPGPQIMYAPAAPAMTQQQQQYPKQQGQQYNQHNSSAGIGGNEDYYGRGPSSSGKDGQYIYSSASQAQHGAGQSTGQQQGANKQRTGGNVYNNQQGQQRPFQ